jgi:hypothetical protein
MDMEPQVNMGVHLLERWGTNRGASVLSDFNLSVANTWCPGTDTHAPSPGCCRLMSPTVYIHHTPNNNRLQSKTSKKNL